jgi:membrane protein
MGTVKTVGKRLFAEIQADDVPGLSAELAYRFLFALFPLFIFIAALGGFAAGLLGIQNPTDRLMQMIGETLPANARSLVTDQLRGVLQGGQGGLLSFGILAALWAASSGMKSTMKAMNRAYDVEESRSFLKKNLVGIGLTLLLGAAIILGFVLLMAGQFFASQIASALGMQEGFSLLVQIAQWPVAALVLLFGMAFLYWAAPNTDIPFRWITPGAVMFVIVWLLATLAFGFYVSNFGNYNATYGALGAVIVLMLWFYISAFVMLLGAELNAVLAKQVAPEQIGTRGRAVSAEEREARRARGAPEPPAHEQEPAPTPRPSRIGTVLGAGVAALAAWRATRGATGH